MTLSEYIRLLQEILDREGDLPVKCQTLTHTWDVDPPKVKEKPLGEIGAITWKPYVLVNP